MKMVKRLWRDVAQQSNDLGETEGELKKLERLLERNATALKSNLGKARMSLFARYADCVTEYVYLCKEEAFCKGYCLGARLTAEALLQSDRDNE